jgi:hypothetical protein
MNLNQPDEITPDLAALAREVAATRSRLRSRFEEALISKTVAKDGWLGRGFLIGAGAAGARCGSRGFGLSLPGGHRVGSWRRGAPHPTQRSAIADATTDIGARRHPDHVSDQ